MLKSANLPPGITGAILRSMGGAGAGIAATYGANKLTGADEWVSPAGAAEQYSAMALLGGLAGSKRIRTRMGNYINPKNEAGVRQVSPMRLALAARAPGLAYGTPLMIDAALHRMFPDDGNLRIEPKTALTVGGSSLLGAGLGWGTGSLLFPDDESLSAKERLRRQNRHLNTKLGLAALGGWLGAAAPYHQQVTAGAKDLMHKVAGRHGPMNLHTPPPKQSDPGHVQLFGKGDAAFASEPQLYSEFKKRMPGPVAMLSGHGSNMPGTDGTTPSTYGYGVAAGLTRRQDQAVYPQVSMRDALKKVYPKTAPRTFVNFACNSTGCDIPRAVNAAAGLKPPEHIFYAPKGTVTSHANVDALLNAVSQRNTKQPLFFPNRTAVERFPGSLVPASTMRHGWQWPMGTGWAAVHRQQPKYPVVGNVGGVVSSALGVPGGRVAGSVVDYFQNADHNGLPVYNSGGMVHLPPSPAAVGLRTGLSVLTGQPSIANHASKLLDRITGRPAYEMRTPRRVAMPWDPEVLRMANP